MALTWSLVVLASADYAKQQEELHAKGNYGVTAHKYGQMISQIVDKLEIDHLLDYGCGSNLSLTKTLRPERNLKYQGYDIGVPEYSGDPVPAEHIEPEYLDNVLDHLEDLTEVVLFASVHMGPAGKTLSDGRNAHLTQEPIEWWLPKFMERFAIQTVQVVSPVEFFVIAHNRSLALDE
jgi:hypothetical protein